MTLVLLGTADEPPRVVPRVPEGAARSENALRNLLFEQPQILPMREIDPAIGPLVPVAKELNVPSVGRIDAFFADRNGNLVIVEAKLWRNPQARREVVGQILDYARALATFSYDDLQREVSRAVGRPGNVLWELVASRDGALSEARFVDQVARNLAAGRFLLVVAGDGITEGTRRIGEYLTAQPGLAFSFAMVEFAQYDWIDSAGREQSIIQPRLLAQTAVIERAIIRNEARVMIDDVRDSEAAPAATAGETGGRKLDPALMQQWRRFAERFLEGARFDDPAQPPPRVGGTGWFRIPLPNGTFAAVWRDRKKAALGAHILFAGPEKRALYHELQAEREFIAGEFADAGLPPPDWEEDEGTARVTVRVPMSSATDEAGEEEEQLRSLHAIANQMVNSFRPRLERMRA